MSTRDRILDASVEVMGSVGLVKATTKQIARAAGISEALVYKHFADKTDLFLAVLRERAPGQLTPVLAELPHRVGAGPVRDTVVDIVAAALDFYGQAFPMAASLFGETRLLAAHRDAVRSRGTGPHQPGAAVAQYLAAERDLGRLRPDLDPDAAATLLLGACFHHAFLRNFDDAAQDADETARLAVTLTETVLHGLLERPSSP